MSITYNRAIYAGYLTDKPELRFTKKGTPVAKATIAVNSKNKDNDAFFMEFRVFGKTAEILEKYSEKGTPLLVEGETRSQNWEYEGKKYYGIYTFTTQYQFLGGSKPGQQIQTGESVVEDDEDIPF